MLLSLLLYRQDSKCKVIAACFSSSPVTLADTHSGNCARVFTFRLLQYRICQGSPHTASVGSRSGTLLPSNSLELIHQAIVLIPTFPPGHIDYPVLPMFLPLVRCVKNGTLPNYARFKPDISKVWPTGVAPRGFSTDSPSITERVQTAWASWAQRRAAEMTGVPGVWDGWGFDDLAP